MKVTSQIITVIIIVTVGWYAYENHQPFHALVDDIIGYAGLDTQSEQTEQIASKVKQDTSRRTPKTGTESPHKMGQASSTAATDSQSSIEDQQPVATAQQTHTGNVPDRKTPPVQNQEPEESRRTVQLDSTEAVVANGVRFPLLPEEESADVSKTEQQQVISEQTEQSVPVEKTNEIISSDNHTAENKGDEESNVETVIPPSAEAGRVQESSPDVASPDIQPKIDNHQISKAESVLPNETEKTNYGAGYRDEKIVPDENGELQGTHSGVSDSVVISNTATDPGSEYGLPQDKAEIASVTAPYGQYSSMDISRPDSSVQGGNTSDNFPESGREIEELFNARDIWQQGNHDLAIKIYSEMMSDYPDNPDFPGELGNIYFSKGLTDQAIDAYIEALQRLLKADDLKRAWNLYSVIKKLSPEKAALLEDEFLPLQN